MKGGEVDLIALSPRGTLVLLEVRGRRKADFLPRQMISSAKRHRLLRLAAILAREQQRDVRIELVEILGEIRARSCLGEALLGWRPEWVGIRMEGLAVE